MSPIRLADLDSDHDDPDSPLYSGDENDRMLRHGKQESTQPKISGKQAIGEKFNEPVAIVGISKLISPALSNRENVLNINTGCRLPGEVKSAADLWDLLKDEKSGHGKVPRERWNIDAFHHKDGGEKIGTMSMVCSI